MSVKLKEEDTAAPAAWRRREVKVKPKPFMDKLGKADGGTVRQWQKF